MKRLITLLLAASAFVGTAQAGAIEDFVTGLALTNTDHAEADEIDRRILIEYYNEQQWKADLPFIKADAYAIAIDEWCFPDRTYVTPELRRAAIRQWLFIGGDRREAEKKASEHLKQDQSACEPAMGLVTRALRRTEDVARLERMIESANENVVQGTYEERKDKFAGFHHQQWHDQQDWNKRHRAPVKQVEVILPKPIPAAAERPAPIPAAERPAPIPAVRKPEPIPSPIDEFIKSLRGN